MRKILASLLICICVLLTVSFGLFLFKGIKETRSNAGYVSATGLFTCQLEEYLNDYYKSNGHYHEKINIMDFSIYKKEEYRKIIEKIEYSTDGNSFEIVWRHPVLPKSTHNYWIWICKGNKGKRSYWNIEEANNKDEDK